jgi:hypothetical protein
MHAVLYLVAVIVIVGALLWGLMQLPIDEAFKKVARIVLIVALVVYAVLVLLNLVSTNLPLLR